MFLAFQALGAFVCRPRVQTSCDWLEKPPRGSALPRNAASNHPKNTAQEHLISFER